MGLRPGDSREGTGAALTRVRKPDLVGHVIESVRELIRSQGLNPGDRLPSEPELKVQLGVGRSTVREATRILSHLGVIEVRPGQGTFVGPRAETPGTDISARMRKAQVGEIQEARRIIECEAAALAAERRSDDDLARMQTAIADSYAAAAVGDVPRFVSADMRFHQAVAAASGNEILDGFYSLVSDAFRDALLELAEVSNLRATTVVHEKILRAIAAGDAAAARRATTRHLTETSRRLMAVSPIDANSAPAQRP